jgi:3-dehydroquinate dehydratase / shikimate dehydrogenase
VTYLCVPIFVRDAQQTLRDVATAVEAGAEMIELRFDTYTSSTPISISTTLPWIATCRPTWEGGHYAGSESDRLQLLKTMGDQIAPYVDLELAAKRITVRAKLILSSHDFHGRPERLNNLLLEMDRAGCDMQKVAWTARTVRDNLEAFEILQKRNRPTIVLCMGEAGIISRILAKKFGAFLTFASLDQDSATAPGQISIFQMKNLYRWDKINPKTKVYGVVAHPVGHSMSPAIHNAAFDAVDYDGIYVPFLVNPGYESFKAFMESFVPFDGLDLCGLSVTLPHKENALRYLQEKGTSVEPLAERIGAVNTIVIQPNRALAGWNTDYVAILSSITTALGCDRQHLNGMPVAILGAGGTGRTAVAALADCNAKITIFNRTPSKATALAQEFGATAAPFEELANSDCRVYMNTTSVGMHPNVDDSPFGDHPPKLGRDNVVFDTIYNPLQTKMLKQAEEQGACTIGGLEMFVQQAAQQFALWTKKTPPTDVMCDVVKKRLANN